MLIIIVIGNNTSNHTDELMLAKIVLEATYCHRTCNWTNKRTWIYSLVSQK